MLRSISIVTAVLATLALVAERATASDVVILRPGDVGEEREFFESLLRKARADCFCDFQMTNFLIGRFDINDDGRYELFVSYENSPFCGTFGCTNPVFQLQNGRWEEITVLDGGTPAMGAFDPRPNPYNYIIVSEERSDSYRTLIGREIGQQWSVDEITGKAAYHAFCLTLACLWDFTGIPEEAMPKPAKRRRKRQ